MATYATASPQFRRSKKHKHMNWQKIGQIRSALALAAPIGDVEKKMVKVLDLISMAAIKYHAEENEGAMVLILESVKMIDALGLDMTSELLQQAYSPLVQPNPEEFEYN